MKAFALAVLLIGVAFQISSGTSYSSALFSPYSTTYTSGLNASLSAKPNILTSISIFEPWMDTFMPRSSGSTNLSLTPNPIGPSGTWQPLFDDEFSGTSLDTTKWVTCYYWATTGCTNWHELEWYKSSQVSLQNGSLRLRADHKTVSGDGTIYHYISGMVTTDRINSTGLPAKFGFQYGYVEASLKVPAGNGLWPAFWLMPIDQSWPPEIDIMEILGKDPTTTYMNYHYIDASGTKQDAGSSFTGPNFSSGYHTFGVNWQPNAITWYVDGVPRFSYTNSMYITSKSMYVLANLAVGGSWGGPPDGSTHFPADYLLNYIRVWKYAGP